MITMRSPGRASLIRASPQPLTVRKGERIAAALVDGGDDFAAGDAAVDRSAEIDRLGHEQNVRLVHVTREAIDQGVSHQAHRPVAVRLEHQQQTAGKVVQGLQRGGDLVGVVGEVVDHGDGVGRAHHLQSPADAAKRRPKSRGFRKADAANLRDT